MLRMEILSRNGLSRQILDESIAYLLYMAERTGTLWENVGSTASCNHGFASHICHTLFRDVLGVYDLDRAGRKVRVRLADSGLDWCEGEIPVSGGRVRVRWRADGARIVYEAVVPAGYTLDVENRTGKELVREGSVAIADRRVAVRDYVRATAKTPAEDRDRLPVSQSNPLGPLPGWKSHRHFPES
jgi:alpha-L-rhamnosidase